MTQNKRVLISGASIAGPTLAYWLSHYGFQVKLIEQAPQLRLGGQNIDVSDAAVDIVKMMNAESLIKAHNTSEEGLVFVDRDERERARFPKGTETSFTSEYEILRGDLARVLYDLSKDRAEYVFDETLEAITQTQDSVQVRFKSGTEESFDIVIGADGVSSNTRRLVFNDESCRRYLRVYGAYMTLPRRAQDTSWARWYNAEGGKVLMLRPDNHGTIRASVFFWQERPLAERLSRADSILLLRQVLAGAGWEADRIAHDMEADPDIYFGPVTQIQMPKWAKGRCALVGDAAYCPTPFTGMGSTLAVIGAYVLAGELSRNSDYREAFANYEKLMRPFVDEVQRLPPGVPRLAYPRSRFAIRVFNETLTLAASAPVQKAIGIFRNLSGSRTKKFHLRVYSNSQTDL